MNASELATALHADNLDELLQGLIPACQKLELNPPIIQGYEAGIGHTIAFGRKEDWHVSLHAFGQGKYHVEIGGAYCNMDGSVDSIDSMRDCLEFVRILREALDAPLQP